MHQPDRSALDAELLTSRHIASLTGRRITTVRKWAREDRRFPPIALDGVNPRRRRADVEHYLLVHRGIEVPPVPVGDVVDDELVNYTQIARMMRVSPPLVRHYAHRDAAFPRAVLDELRRRTDVVAYVERRLARYRGASLAG